MENAEGDQVPKEDDPVSIKEIPSTHTLGLQDLYKAAFSQETDTGFTEFSEKTTIITPDLVPQTYSETEAKIAENLEKPLIVYKNENFDQNYQLYALKGLQYSVDFGKPEEATLDLNYDPSKQETGTLSSAVVLNRSFDPSFQNDANSVLDLDKGIQIHVVKDVDLVPGQNNFEPIEYTGDAQILQRYLCDAALLKSGGTGAEIAETVNTEALSFVTKQNNNVLGKIDSEGVGVNPEVLGVRFEDCDFNSSDSFASTESIIPKNIKCPKCPKKFMFKSDLLRHDKYKHSVKLKLFCKYCNKEFVSQQNLFFHEKSHKKKKTVYRCETCKKVFSKSSVLAKHMMKKHSQPPFSCGHCEEVFPTQVLLNSHFGKAHMTEADKPYKCEVCSKSFEKKQGLSVHAKSHVEDHPFVCEVCSKSFLKLVYLKRHQKIHSNEEKGEFVCETCGKDFKTSSALEMHSKKHVVLVCEVCNRSFSSKAHYTQHMKKHDDGKALSCAYCQKTFSSNADLNKHEKIHTKDKIFHCFTCNLTFSQQSQLTAHQKKQKCNENKSQEVCTQTFEFVDANLQTVPLQDVNVIVDPSFELQQPIVLTSIGSFIDSNSVPVILTQNPSGPYSVSSIT